MNKTIWDLNEEELAEYNRKKHARARQSIIAAGEVGLIGGKKKNEKEHEKVDKI